MRIYFISKKTRVDSHGNQLDLRKFEQMSRNIEWISNENRVDFKTNRVDFMKNRIDSEKIRLDLAKILLDFNKSGRILVQIE